MYTQIYLEASFWLLLSDIDEKIAHFYHQLPCFYCAKRMYWGNYPRKPRGLPPMAEDIFAFRYGHCCSGRRRRRTPPSARFLGRRVYVASFIMMIFCPDTSNDNDHMKLVDSVSVGMDLITPIRWISWWSLDIPVSSIWKKICGLLGINISNEFLPHFISHQFAKKNINAEKAVLALLEFLAPIAVPKDYPPSS